MRRRFRVFLPVLLTVSILRTGFAAQDPRPTYDSATGPVVAFDEMHNTSHTYAGRFSRFVEVVRADGYRPRPRVGLMSVASLQDVAVLVITNPAPLEGHPYTFAGGEVEAIVAWIKAGGSLLLIADHPPYPLGASKLAAALGVRNWLNGTAAVDGVPGLAPDMVGSIISFWRTDSFPGGKPGLVPLAPASTTLAYQGADAVLAKHLITEGRSSSERIQRVTTFGGSAFQALPGGEALLTLPHSAIAMMVQQEGQHIDDSVRAPFIPVDGWLQGAVMAIGKGRIAIFAEIGLFGGATGGEHRQFVLNVMHWLSRAL